MCIRRERERERERERDQTMQFFQLGWMSCPTFILAKKMKILRIKTTWYSADQMYTSVWTTQHNLFFHVYLFPFTLEEKLGQYITSFLFI